MSQTFAPLVAALLFVTTSSARAERTIINCTGMERGYDRAKHVKLPATQATRIFAFDDATNSISEYLNQNWSVLDADALVDQTDISARYTHDYPNGRVDVIFEFNRLSDSLIYIVDIDEKPGELFAAHCDVRPPPGK